MELRAPDTGTMTRRVFKRRRRGAPRLVAHCWGRDGAASATHHDGEVESIVMEDDAVLVLGVRGRARYAQVHVPKRQGHNRVPRALQCWLLRHEELFGFQG